MGSTGSTAPPVASTVSSTAWCSTALQAATPPAAASTPRTARLSASVPPLVNTTSPGSAPTSAATVSRASSSRRRASRAHRWEPDGLPGTASSTSTTAASTSGRTGDEAAWSRYAVAAVGTAGWAGVKADTGGQAKDSSAKDARRRVDVGWTSGRGPGAASGDDRPRVLELGVGTGRLAIPLAGAGVQVTGLDASSAMLAALATKPGGDAVRVVLGDMVDPSTGDPSLADERFHLVLVAYNTLFNLVDDGAQQRCLERAASLLGPGGCVVVEAFVPDPGATSGDSVTTRQVTADRVVLSVSRTDASAKLVVGQYVDITGAGVQLRPWQVRWSAPDHLDTVARAAGLTLDHRWADWDRTPFTPDAPSHVSVYRSA